MNSYIKNAVFIFLMIMMFAGFYPSTPAWSQEKALPESVSAQISTSLAKVGQGTYRKLGFRIYDATLWASQNTWDAAKPYALQLSYTRSLSKETLVDTVMDNIQEQRVADEVTLARWKDVLNFSLRDVKEGDVLVGLAVPGKKTLLFYNGANIASVEDQAFSDAFFGVWLGKYADEDLRSKLLGGTF